jgi:hypothetical protein
MSAVLFDGAEWQQDDISFADRCLELRERHVQHAAPLCWLRLRDGYPDQESAQCDGERRDAD